MRITSLEDYHQQYQKSIENPAAFWDKIAQNFYWQKKWDSVYEADFEKAKFSWFKGAELNITENCLDRHVRKNPDKIAFHWEPNNPSEDSINITYQELQDRVCRFSYVLHEKGIGKGDRVCLYMPMIPELVVAMLACARIGAVHSIVFAGFSSKALENRINDAQCKLLITANSFYRGSKLISLKEICDVALENTPTIENVIVYRRTIEITPMQEGRDTFWFDELSKAYKECDPAVMNAEDPLFILYTSGSTGKPKGVVHTCGGYMVGTTYSFENVFQVDENDVYWCTADIGWITGHSYIVYGPLAFGATSVLFEGVPTYPDYRRFWQIVQKYQVSHFYTAPTAIRMLAKQGEKYVDAESLTSLKILGTVGEPINEEAWEWYNEVIGQRKCPILDTWWQTETGAIMISALADVTPNKPTFATLPLPGVLPALMDEDGKEIVFNGKEIQGNLCIKNPWPSMARTIWSDHERFKKVYFSTYKGKYFTGDGALRDADGNYRITGRVDDIIIISGHNLSTAPIENAINEIEIVGESAIVGYPDDIKGNALYAFISLKEGTSDEESIKKAILEKISQDIGAIAKPSKIQIVEDLPKTRSGKIMRRILRKIAAGERDFGDTSTLLNPDVVEKIKAKAIS
ncbi:acetate--CoA ligase [Mesonia sp. K7]|uniref:acetate--CoA ligase n=1 Tax=Mesonia sp. K7 TaxID=2218606 RepID=UPI000DAA383F|nr:acetate--CoA ligase [Mesonia sp. K7]PZD77021.1 acetate--CoA ligase [Mesonia sp. K7]